MPTMIQDPPTLTEYAAFLDAKAQMGEGSGFEPLWMPDFLFPFQQHLTQWAIRKGKAAIFADCGLGKTPCQLVWAENMYRKTGKPVLILTPLAVAFQTKREAEKFGIEVAISRDGTVAGPITIANYERLHHFHREDFGAVVCDESSAIKSFDGVTRTLVTAFMRHIPYRLLCTATAAPNDYIELGTSSEALGELGIQDMLSRFFINKDKTNETRSKWNGQNRGEAMGWRFKGHAEQHFWRWVSSWARAMRKPSDCGFADDGFVLPPLVIRNHVVTAARLPDGLLFDLPAVSLHEQRDEQRRSLEERAALTAELVAQHNISAVFCQLNIEGDLLERVIPHSIQVQGSDSTEYKEDAALWFKGELCVCHNPLFRAKLATWTRKNTTDLTTTRTEKRYSLLTESDGLLELTNSVRRAKATTRRGSTATETTSKNTGALPPVSATLDDASYTQPNQIGGNVNSKRLRSGKGSIQNNGLLSGLESLGSLPMSTTDYLENKAEGVLSVDVPTAVTELDSESIIATYLGRSEGSFATHVTSGSESLEMISTDLSERQCICGHTSGRRVLISKSSIFGLGLNFQHCAHIVYFPSHSYEQYYQVVRRFWRFGQQHPVEVDVVTTQGGGHIMASLERKAKQAEEMFASLVAHMNNAITIERQRTFNNEMVRPSWL